MNQEEIKKLAIECGLVNGVDVESTFLDWKKEIEAYTEAVEAPLQARIAQLEEAFKIVETQAVMIGVNECSRIAHSAVTELPSTWLSEHDKDVKAKERERCALIADIQPHANSIASRIRELT